MNGNCYVSAEALFHILGGKKAGWKAMRVRCSTFNGGRPAINKMTHWFLKHKTGVILDPSVRQFTRRKGLPTWDKPDYSKAVGTGFLTKGPSKRARAMIKRLTWQ